MCTYLTEKVTVEGSGKGAAGWFGLTEATVYFDHPQHARAEHTLNIDFLNPGQGPSARVAVELTAASARALAAAIESALCCCAPGLALRSPRVGTLGDPGMEDAGRASDAGWGVMSVGGARIRGGRWWHEIPGRA